MDGIADATKKAFSYGDYVVNNKNVYKTDKQKAIKTFLDQYN